MVYVGNAFSLSMLAGNSHIMCERIDLERARSVLGTAHMSCIGHSNTAEVFGDQLGLPLAANRVSVELNSGDKMIVGQYKGPRLPERATSLPEGATIEWWFVCIE